MDKEDLGSTAIRINIHAWKGPITSSASAEFLAFKNDMLTELLQTHSSYTIEINIHRQHQYYLIQIIEEKSIVFFTGKTSFEIFTKITPSKSTTPRVERLSSYPPKRVLRRHDGRTDLFSSIVATRASSSNFFPLFVSFSGFPSRFCIKGSELE